MTTSFATSETESLLGFGEADPFDFSYYMDQVKYTAFSLALVTAYLFVCRPRSLSSQTAHWRLSSSFLLSSVRDMSWLWIPMAAVSCKRLKTSRVRMLSDSVDEGVIDKKTWLAFLGELEEKNQ